jgi:hypothetical protein
MGAKKVCLGRLDSAQYADLWGPEARVPGTAPAPANCPPAASGAAGASCAVTATARAEAMMEIFILKDSGKEGLRLNENRW